MSSAPLTKSQIMLMVLSGRTRESFEHSTEGMFDITQMRKEALESERAITAFPLTPELETFIRANRVWEQERVDFFAAQYERWEKPEPAMFYETTENGEPSHLLIDGTHRILAAYALKMPWFIAWFFEESDIRRPPPGWGLRADLDWGDQLIDGKIVKRT